MKRSAVFIIIFACIPTPFIQTMEKEDPRLMPNPKTSTGAQLLSPAKLRQKINSHVKEMLQIAYTRWVKSLIAGIAERRKYNSRSGPVTTEEIQEQLAFQGHTTTEFKKPDNL